MKKPIKPTNVYNIKNTKEDKKIIYMPFFVIIIFIEVMQSIWIYELLQK